MRRSCAAAVSVTPRLPRRPRASERSAPRTPPPARPGPAAPRRPRSRAASGRTRRAGGRGTGGGRGGPAPARPGARRPARRRRRGGTRPGPRPRRRRPAPRPASTGRGRGGGSRPGSRSRACRATCRWPPGRAIRLRRKFLITLLARRLPCEIPVLVEEEEPERLDGAAASGVAPHRAVVEAHDLPRFERGAEHGEHPGVGGGARRGDVGAVRAGAVEREVHRELPERGVGVVGEERIAQLAHAGGGVDDGVQLVGLEHQGRERSVAVTWPAGGAG